MGWTVVALCVEGDEGDPGVTVGALLSLFVGEDEGEAASEDGEALVGDADEALVGYADDADDADLHSSASIAAGRT